MKKHATSRESLLVMWEARWRDSVTCSFPAHVATGDVPGTMIRAGDVVVLDASPGDDPNGWIREGCGWNRLPLSELGALHDALETTYAADQDSFFELPAALLPVMDGEWFMEYLTDPDGGWLTEYAGMPLPYRPDEPSCVIVVRPLRSSTSQPIQATSDDGALFELLAQVGGRMPPGSPS